MNTAAKAFESSMDSQLAVLQPVEKAFRQAADASQLKQTCIGNVIFL